MSREQLVGKIKDEMTPWIENMVDRKTLQPLHSITIK